MTEIQKLQAWITDRTQLVENRITRSVGAFENNLPQPKDSDCGPLCSQLHHAHRLLGDLTVGALNRRSDQTNSIK